MTISAIDTANRALLRVGADRIASFDEDTPQAVQAAAEYEPLLREHLTRRRWRFATAEAGLNLLADTPKSGRWTRAHQLPGDLLALHNATSGGVPIDYDRLGDKLFANEAGPLVIEYTWRVPERLWPGHFSGAFVRELAALFAKGLLGNLDLARSEERQAQPAWQQAALEDSQQRTARHLPPSRLVRVRRGGRF